MNRLPQVLQNEIWEYVRGDRKFWKQEFSRVLSFFRDMKERVTEVSFRGTEMYWDNDSGDETWTMDFLKGRQQWIVFNEEFDRHHHDFRGDHCSAWDDVHLAMREFVECCTDEDHDN